MSSGKENDFDKFSFENLDKLLRRAKQSWRLLAMLSAIAFVLSLVAIAVWPRSYTAFATIAPATSLGTSDAPGGAMSALAAIGGKSLLGGSSQVSPFEMYVDVLNSKRLAQQLAEKDHFLQIVFANKWDAQAHKWRPRTGIIHFIGDSLKGVFGLTTKEAPDIDDLSAFLSHNLVVANKESETSPLSSIATIKFTFKDRAQTVAMLNAILSEADMILRVSRRTDVQSRIAYLTSALRNVEFAEQRQSLISILSTQEEQYTVIEADKRYAFALLDPPYASSVPTWPIPLLVVVGFLFAALVIWLGLILVLPENSRILGVLTAPAHPARSGRSGVAGGSLVGQTHAKSAP
jgi:hypothetical protein